MSTYKFIDMSYSHKEMKAANLDITKMPRDSQIEYIKALALMDIAKELSELKVGEAATNMGPISVKVGEVAEAITSLEKET